MEKLIRLENSGSMEVNWGSLHWVRALLLILVCLRTLSNNNSEARD